MLSKIYTVEEVVDFLTTNGYPALPVAPKQDAEKFPLSYKDKDSGEWTPILEKDGTHKPRFTGKNPSYLDSKGYPRTVTHSDYHHVLPKDREIIKWFHNSFNGVGTLGGWQDTVWIDLDVKRFSGGQNELDLRFNALLEANPVLKSTWLERTHSGGYRIAVKPKIKPTFTNFSLNGVAGDHHGEALGEGRFTVLAPTIGASGNAYINLNLAVPVEVESLESIGIYPISGLPEHKAGFIKVNDKNDKVVDLTSFRQNQTQFTHKIEILELLSARNKQALKGVDVENDKSKTLTNLIKEISGWENELNPHGIGAIEDLNKSVFEAGEALGLGINRIKRILNSVDTLNTKPAYWFQNGDISIWDKIRIHNNEIFEKCCPIKQKVLDNIFDKNLARFKKSRKLENSEKQNNRYLQLPDLPKEGYLIVIKSAMESGKTYGLLKALRERYEEDSKGFFWLAHRIKLIHQTHYKAIHKFGLKSSLLNDADIKEGFGFSLVQDDSECIFLCGESFEKIESNTRGRDVIIDETCAAILQLNLGGTVRGAKQAKVLKSFETASKNCRNLIVMDANMSPDEVNLLAAMSGKKLLIIENESKPNQGKFIFLKSLKYNEKTEEYKEVIKDTSAITKRIIDSELPFIVCDSKNFLMGVLEGFFNEKHGFTLCQETANETWQELQARKPGSIEYFKPDDSTKKWADELLSDPDKFIIRYKPKYLAISPTGESGISIEIKEYFTEKFLLSVGVLSLNSLSQMPFRLRDNSIPCYVAMPNKGLFESDRDFYLGAQELSLDDRLARHKLVAQAIAENDEETAQRIKVAELAYSRLSLIWDDYGKVIAERDAQERGNYKAFFKVMLAEMGHEIVDLEDKFDEKIKGQSIDNKSDYLNERAQKLFDCPDVSFKEADKNYQKNPSDRNALIRTKAKIIDGLPGINESPFWSPLLVSFILKDPLYRTKNDYYYLLKNPKILKDWADYYGYGKLTKQAVSNHHLNNKKVEIITGMLKMGLPKLINYLEKGKEISQDCEIVKKIVTQGRKKDIKLLIGFEPNKKTEAGGERIKYIKKLLEVVGLKLAAEPQQRLMNDGVRKRFYSLDPIVNCDIRKTILAHLPNFYEKWKIEKYSKPDWEYSATHNGDAIETFIDDEKNITQHEDNGYDPLKVEESIITFWHEKEIINYEFPHLATIKTAGLYYQYQQDLIDIDKISGNQESLAKALQLLEDMEKYPIVKEQIIEGYPIDFPQPSLLAASL